MSEREQYPAGVPCWVEVLVPEPRKALDFYGSLFDWTFDGPGPMPDEPEAEYFVASVRGRDVAGLGSLPSATSLFRRPGPRTSGSPARRTRLAELRRPAA